MTHTGHPAATTVHAVAGYASILVPLDGSELAERALGPARELALRFGAGLHVVTAGVGREDIWWYERYLDRIREQVPGVAVHVSSVPDAADGIIATARAEGSCLVCLSTHGRARSAAITGSTFAAVAKRIGHPLVAVGPRVLIGGNDQSAGRIVACLDGGPLAERVLPTVAAWAHRFDLRVSLVTAADPVLLRSRLARERAEATRPYGHHGDPMAYLHAAAALPVLAGLDVDTEVLWGLAHPHIAIGEHLDRHPALLVAATTHARTGLTRMALGSNVARIVHRVPVPVLVEPPGRP
ncbi:MAG TPA: universal stress protein [Acidimicrobiales bacterium]|nr:universal stress protein [Acidimicrobiales bacterium]